MQKPLKQFYEIRQSGIHAQGLFATDYIAEGSRIIEYLGEKIRKEESERRALEWEEKAREKNEGLVYIFELNKRYDIDGNFDYNDARLMNHSCDPNCEAVQVSGHIWISAMKDIRPGDELTYDYGYDMSQFLDHPCQCGAENCIGYIVREDQRRKVKQLLKKH